MPIVPGVTGGRRLWLALTALGGFVGGILLQSGLFPTLPRVQANGPEPNHARVDPAVKAPVAGVLHCPLAFAGVHLLKEFPELAQVAYHYCKPLNDDVTQCLVYNSTSPDARLIGVEYLVSDAIYQKMPA